MSIKFIDSFSHYDEPLLKYEGGTTLFYQTTTSQVRNLSNTTGSTAGWDIRKIFDPTSNTIILGAAFKPFTENSGAVLRLFTDNNARNYAFRFSVTGGIQVLDNSSSLVVPIILPGTWNPEHFHYLEVKVEFSVTANVTIRVDHVIVASFVLDTATGATGFDEVQLGGINTSQGDTATEDFYIIEVDGVGENDFLGDVRIDLLLPESNEEVMFTPTESNNFSSVNETIADLTTLVESGTIGDLDNYNYGNLEVLGTEIYAVQNSILSIKNSADIIQAVNTLTVNGIALDSSTLTITDSWFFRMDAPHETDNSGVDWTEASVNSIQAGMRIV